ncbi:MAG: beta-galactosidase, partial [Bacteroidota bacterium]
MKLGVCYYPEHWPDSLWKQDAEEMKALGLSLVRIGEFAWSKIEPRENEFHFEWLDKAIETLANAGLKIILGIPSATPPRWVLDKFPDMLAWDIEGRPRKFGSRRHYCFSHDSYRNFAARMAERLSERYGKHPALYGWQTDNEYGCHDTIRSYSPIARKAFRVWLREKYVTIEQLNKRWGNTFWSMEYNSFDQIDLPNLTVTEANPIHTLDFHRFSSDQVVRWDKAQIDAIRKYSDLPICHNYMGRITDFDHFKLGEQLEFASWDSYPLGFLEDRSDRDEAFRHQYQKTGDPDFQAFHHDLYRGVGKGNWGIMEQQAGPVNWAPHNPAPADGMVKLWTLEAMAHGADFVCYFRWRQCAFAQEQMHSGLKRTDNKPTNAYYEIQELSKQIKAFNTSEKPKAEVALLFDYESQWAWEVQPQGQDFDYFRLSYDYYCALRKLGVNIDIISEQHTHLNHYKMILIPGLFNISDSFHKRLSAYEGMLLLGPRTHSKTEDFHLNIDSISSLLDRDLKINYVESIRPSERRDIDGIGNFVRWLEYLEIDGKAVNPLIQVGNIYYVGG